MALDAAVVADRGRAVPSGAGYGHPFERQGLLRRAWPFAAMMVLALAVAPLPPFYRDPSALLIATALTLVIVASVVLVPWQRLPRTAAAIPPLLYLVVVAVLREPFDTVNSGYAPLALVPVLWLALHGRRSELMIAVAGTGVMFLAPLAWLEFANSELRGALVYVTVSVLIGLVVHRLVRRLRTTASIVENSDDAIIASDRAGRIVGWNRGAEQIYGYSTREAVGRELETTVPVERAGEEKEILRRVLDGDAVAHFETTRVRSDGSEFDASVSASPVRDSSGLVVAGAVIVRDVSARKHAERALREAEERFHRAFEAAPIGMAILDLEGRFASVNDALCELTGYSEEELGVTSLPSISHPDELPATEQALGALRAGETETRQAEVRYLRPAGPPRWVAEHITVIPDVEGQPLHLLLQAQDVTERRDYEDRLQHMADHDPLTGLFNRRRFERELERQAEHMRRYGEPGAAIVIDLDHFKYINDSLGHAAGDELIISAAGALRDRVRATDVLARLGGDEFAVLLPRATEAEAVQVGEEICKAIRAKATVFDGSRRLKSTASVGVACFEPDGGDLSGEDVIVNADLAMYDAKEAGRDRVATYSVGEYGRPKVKARMTWVDRIRSALEEDRLVLHAQPILDLQTGRVDRHEMLMRMTDPGGDTIPPGTFLYIAERFDLIQPIDRFAVREAIALIARLDAEGRDDSLEVNLSGKSIGDPALLETIESELSTSGVDPSRLILEVTETAAVANIPRARAFAEHLGDIGCRFALDDFGAGFGSFYYLKHLPFDFLKIDGEFVRQCVTSRTDMLIIDSVVEIARGLGKETIAEYVEDERTLRHLRRHGVDFAQGFHVGRPAPTLEAMGVSASGDAPA